MVLYLGTLNTDAARKMEKYSYNIIVHFHFLEFTLKYLFSLFLCSFVATGVGIWKTVVHVRTFTILHLDYSSTPDTEALSKAILKAFMVAIVIISCAPHFLPLTAWIISRHVRHSRRR